METRVLALLLVACLPLLDAHVLQTSTNEEAKSLNNEVDSKEGSTSDGHYQSDYFNDWVDKLLAKFATNVHTWQPGSSALLENTAAEIVNKVDDRSVDEALTAAFSKQCDSSASHTLTLAGFHQKLSEKKECLSDITSNLRMLLGHASQELTVRDQVTATILCRVVPKITTCLSPVLEAIVQCTGDGEAAKRLFHDFQTRQLRHYCSRDEHQHGALESLQTAGPHCVENGIGYLLKYFGPAFLRNLSAEQPQHYPCVYSRYFLSAADVVLRQYCGASVFMQQVREFVGGFNSAANCGNCRTC